mmetsp:Transcript_59170/g.138463  ORF Transcript_59170/g.138463 Transcript_59170/m.138463 type:complete len:1133 (+) Transcript_59170:27-3425(+)
MAWPLLSSRVVEKSDNAEVKSVQLMPKLPLNGPSGHLQAEILLGKSGEFDFRVTSKRLAQNLSRIPATARLHRPLPPLQENCESRTHRQRRTGQAGEFASDLHKIDHLHLVQSLPDDGTGSHATDQADAERPDQGSLQELGVPERDVTSLMAGTTSSRSLFSSVASSEASLTSASQVSLRRDADALGAAGRKRANAISSRSQRSNVLVGEPEPWVLDRLKACFQHSFSEVKAQLLEMERVLTGPNKEGDGDDDTPVLAAKKPNRLKEKEKRMKQAEEATAQASQAGEVLHHVASMQAAFEASGLEGWEQPQHQAEVKAMASTTRSMQLHPLAASVTTQAIAEASDKDEEEEEENPEEEIATSSDVEAFRSAQMLCFVRRLCGLPLVDLNLHLEAACRIFCEVLQPLQPPAGVRAARLGDGHGPDLSHATTKFLELQLGQVSVVHSEGSLVDAVEEGFAAMHARTGPPRVVVQHEKREVTWRHRPQQELRKRQASFKLQKEKLLLEQQNFIKNLQDRRKPAEEEDRAAAFPSTDRRMNTFDCRPDQDLLLVSDIFRDLQPLLHHMTKMTKTEEHSGPSHTNFSLRTDIIRPNEEGRHATAGCHGDTNGAFAIRRKLLSPSLRGFGGFRRNDTCVLWTGSSVVGSGMEGCVDNHVDAICYPPCGWVPGCLLKGWQLAWTIMPDTFRYGPTTETSVSVWQVKIDFVEGRPVAIERQAQVPVKGFAVDCAAHGEPFCIIFWPDMTPPSEYESVGVEVKVSGLTGPAGADSELSFFYQVAPFRQEDMCKKMALEARRLHEVISNQRLWAGSSLPVERPRRLRRASDFLQQHKSALQPMSHASMDIIVDGVDLTVTIRAPVQAINAELHVVRFGGDEDTVPRAAQAQRLPNWNFLIRVKIPLPRARYQLRIQPDSPEDGPGLCYSITFNEATRVPALLTSLDEPLAMKFGYAPITSAGQVHGVVLLSPLMFRIPAGTAYFLIWVNKAVALEAEEPEKSTSLTTLFASRLGASPPESVQLPAMMSKGLAKSMTKDRRSALQTLQAQLSGQFGPYVQDSSGDVHLDLSFKDGKCVRRLHERTDMPGFFEGFLTFGQVDAQSKVKLFLRLPGKDARGYKPRLLCEWLICRAHGEPLPKGFT